MYQPETEDMIPRCAPKPSVSGVNEAIIRPSVPEVSIVFNQPESSRSSCTPPSSTTSYAAWKKQCLPQVVYPVSIENSNPECPVAIRSNVYPMRTAATVAPTIHATVNQCSLNTSESANLIRRASNIYSQPLYSTESPMAHCNPTYTVTTSCGKINDNNQQRNPIQTQIMNTNVLTICAGTQTDFVSSNKNRDLTIDQLATKEDIAQTRNMIMEMRIEQRQLIEMLQHLITSQKNEKSKDCIYKRIKDVATQCDGQNSIGHLPQKRPHLKYDSIEEEDLIEEENLYHFQKKTTGLGGSPAKIQQTHSEKLCAGNILFTDGVLQKPATEQSIVMNELALKYLPNEKLSELLQELHVSGVTGQTQKIFESPLKNIGNYGKSPSDMSTASYKYLKKYRLLPEENNNRSPTANVRKVHQQENILDLEAIRRQPKFM